MSCISGNFCEFRRFLIDIYTFSVFSFVLGLCLCACIMGLVVCLNPEFMDSYSAFSSYKCLPHSRNFRIVIQFKIQSDLIQ